MKKFLLAAVSALLAAGIAVSASGCGTSVRVKVIDVMLTGEEYGYCVDKDNTELMTAVNELIEDLCGSAPYNAEDPVTDVTGVAYDLNGDGTEETVTFDSLYKAFTQEGSTRYNVADALSELPANADRTQYLVVATNAEFEPFEYMNGSSYTGIDMHIAKMLAEKLNKTLVIKHMEFEVVITDVENGSSDIGMAGLTINRGREQVVSFSDGYYTTSQYLAVAESDTRFDNCKTEADVVAVINGLGSVSAGAATGQTGYFYIAGSTDFEFAGFANVDVQDYESVALAVQNLSNGRVELVVADGDTLRSAVAAVNERIPAESAE